MKRLLLILCLGLLPLQLCSRDYRYDSIEIYAFLKDSFSRFPITSENITQYYEIFYKYKNLNIDIEKFKKYAVEDDYKGTVRLRIDFNSKNKKTILCFNEKNMEDVKIQLKNYFPCFYY